MVWWWRFYFIFASIEERGFAAMGGAPVKRSKNIFWRYVQINEWLVELRWFRVQKVLWRHCRYLESVRSTSLKIVHEQQFQIWARRKNFFRFRFFRIFPIYSFALKFRPSQKWPPRLYRPLSLSAKKITSQKKIFLKLRKLINRTCMWPRWHMIVWQLKKIFSIGSKLHNILTDWTKPTIYNVDNSMCWGGLFNFVSGLTSSLGVLFARAITHANFVASNMIQAKLHSNIVFFCVV